jgi:predicted AAA+ superfamily ATPase
VETTISRDILMMSRVDKPALLRRLFELGALYSGRILSFNKMLGQLQDAGNATTLSHYLDLLGTAGLMTGLRKYSAAPRQNSAMMRQDGFGERNYMAEPILVAIKFPLPSL